MVLVESDRASISQYVIDECKRLRLDLNESARNRINAIALGEFCRTGLRTMRERVAWELAFLAPTMNVKGKTVANDRASDREIVLWTGEPRRVEAIRAYLSGIGCPLFNRGKRYYSVVPKSYSVADVKKRVSDLRNGHLPT